MTEPKTIARDVAARLKARSISIKHVQALDLVAAGFGLANRHVLASLRDLPRIRRVNAALLSSAATALAIHDAERRGVIVDETTTAIMAAVAPAPASTIPLRGMVEAAVSEIEADDDIGFDDEDEDPMLDYDRIAAIIARDHPSGDPMGPLELALRDGADRCRDLLASLSDDPSTAGGAVREWVAEIDAAFVDAKPSIKAQRDLLSRGGDVVSNILHWLASDDLLRPWMDVSMYPDAIDNGIDFEESGVERRFMLPTAGIRISSTDLASPERWLATPAASPVIKRLVENCHFSRWESQRELLPKELRVKIASRAIDLLRTAKTPEERRLAGERAIIESARHNEPEDEWFSTIHDEASNLLDEIEEDVAECAIDGDGYDRDEWMDALQAASESELLRKDDSMPKDILSSHDRVEILIHFVKPGHDLESMCEFHGPFTKPADLIVDDSLQHGLAVLGWTIGDFRRETNNDRPSRNLDRSVRRNPDRLIDGPKLVEIIENACSRSFNFVAYANVSLLELLDLDLSRPIAFSQAAIATHNLMAGTFQDVIVKREIVLQDGVHGSLQTTDVGYSPDDVCGLVMSYYDAEIYDPEARRRGACATAALDGSLAVEGLRRSHPGLRIRWSPTDGPLALEASIGVYDAAHGYGLRTVSATFDSLRSEVPEISIQPKP